MAKRTKKEIALTPEEKLQQELVPVEEQPYPVPANWCWVRHNTILDISGGSQPAKSLFISEPRDGYIQLYQTRDYGEHPVPVYIPIEYATKTTNEGDILLARYGGSLGKVFRAHNGAYNVALAKVTKLIPATLNDEFLFLYYQSHFYQDFCVHAASGRSAQAGFNRNDMDNLLFPLPPLPEQQRIVARIDSLFAKLDEVKEKAQAVVDGYENRKAAILHKAFTGELTAKWRKEQGINITSWKHTDLQAVCSMKITDGTHKTPTYCERDEGFPFISAKDITGETICWDNIKYIVPELHTELYARLAPQRDDILLAKNGTTGVAAIVDVDKVFDLYVTIAVLRPNKEIIEPRFLLDIVNSPICKRQFDEHLTGIGVPNLHLRDIKAVAINLPIREEQKEIVHLVDSMIEAENTIKSAAESVLDQIDTMKKSILARAFRGELGTDDPSDEPAIELLKRVLQEE